LKGRKLPVRFRNSKNRKETWARRGLKPRWLIGNVIYVISHAIHCEPLVPAPIFDDLLRMKEGQRGDTEVP